MMISVIVPVYNDEVNINACLKAVCSSLYKDYEVIVVDDASTDKSAEIARNFPCTLVSLKQNSGPSFARNIGVKKARGDILVFLDSDVLIDKNHLSYIAKRFLQEKNLSAVTGIFTKGTPRAGFLSRYKNYYLHYYFSSDFEDGFIFGAICAFRTEKFIFGWPEAYRYAEDAKLTQSLLEQGYAIEVDQNIQVQHLKAWSFKRLLKNDFMIPFSFTKIFLERFFLKKSTLLKRKKNFSHVKDRQLLSIALVALALLSILFRNVYLTSLSLVFWYICNKNFLKFMMSQEMRPFWSIRILIFNYFDQFVMGLGILFQILYFFSRFRFLERASLANSTVESL